MTSLIASCVRPDAAHGGGQHVEGVQDYVGVIEHLHCTHMHILIIAYTCTYTYTYTYTYAQ